VLQDQGPEDGSAPRHAVLLLDLDRFQAVNDRLGRALGDALLSLVGQRLLRETRDDDLVARIGGDDFAILVANGEQTEALAGRLLTLLARPFVVEGHVVNLTASIGIARAAPGRSAELLMKQADLAVYAAKTAGRQTWRLYEPALGERTLARRGLDTDLRTALARNELRLAWQPQCETHTRQRTGFAVSPSWMHPLRGAVPPAVFLPLAEELGCLVMLRDWTLNAVCAEAARWPAPLGVSLALSAQQLDDPAHLVETVQAALNDSGLAPDRLELELTGSALLPREGPAIALMQRLRDLGVRVAMTGFSAGWGSLRQMRAFAFDRAKIDATLVGALQSDAETAAMVRAIITLAADLGMTTVAEGVENPAQAAILASLGCQALEGRLVGEAMDTASAAASLQNPVSA
jgi:diguanylate cyclase (GGDEF)-like protein